MKKLNRTSMRALCGAMLVAGLLLASTEVPQIAFAQDAAAIDGGVVAYDGRTKELTYSGDAQHAFTFDGVMPGDTVSWEFKVRASGLNRPVSLYMRQGNDSAVLTELSSVSLDIELDGRVVYEGTLDDGLSGASAIKLAELENGSTHSCRFTIGVPVELGSETMGALAELDWQLVVQDDGESDGGQDGQGDQGDQGGPGGNGDVGSGAGGTGPLPQTGDASAAQVCLLMLAGTGVLVVAAVLGRCERSDASES